MNKADEVLAAMNTRQRYRCKRAELIAYGFTYPTFREWVNLGRPCCVHQDWKPGKEFLKQII